MSAYTVDISKHLEDSIKFIKLGPKEDDVLKVDDNKNTVIKIQEILNNDDSNKGMEKAMELAIGKEGVEKINSMNLSFSAYQNIFIGIMAAISATTFEETEKRFRNK